MRYIRKVKTRDSVSRENTMQTSFEIKIVKIAFIMGIVYILFIDNKYILHI